MFFLDKPDHLNSGSPAEFAHLVASFNQGLNEVGFVEGRNAAIEYRWARGQYARLHQVWDTDRLPMARICGWRRSAELWNEPSQLVSRNGLAWNPIPGRLASAI
jgi:hypothetical protein